MNDTGTISFDKNRQNQLAATAISLETLLNNMEESFLLVDRSLTIMAMNQTAKARTILMTGNEIGVGSNVLEVALPERRPMLLQLYEDVFRGEKRITEFSMEKDGGQITIETHFKPLKNEEGEVYAALITSRDISDRRKAEQALVDSEQLWRFALEGSGKGVWDWNLATDEVLFSPGWKKLFSYGEDNTVGNMNEWSSRLHPDDRLRMNANINTHLNSGDPFFESTFRFRIKDGSYRWIQSQGMITEWNEQGRPQRMVGTHTDITERKKKEENYKLLFYGNPLPMWTFERVSCRFLEVNDAAVRHYGYSREEFLQMTIFDIRPPEDQEPFRVDREVLVQSQEIRQKYYRHKKKDGTCIYVNITANVFENEGRNICLVLAEDITEKIEAENRLKQSELQYKLLFANSPLPACVFDRENYHFLDVNEAALRLYGYSREEFLSKTLFDIRPAEEKPKLREFIDKHRHENNNLSKTFTHQTKDGELIVVEVTSNLIDYQGKEARMCVINNVTDRVRVEQELLRSNERFLMTGRATSDAIYDWDMSRNTWHWGEGLFELFGWKGEEINIETWKELVHVKDRARTFSSLEEALENTLRSTWREEYRFQRADGTYRDVLERSYIIRNAEGKAIRMIGALQDITDIKRKEKELSVINERFKAAAKATSEVLWESDMVNATMYLSPVFRDLFGFDMDPAHYYQTWFEYLHPEDRERALTEMASAFRNREQDRLEVECRHLKADGTYAYIINHCLMIRDGEGHVVKLVGAIQDLTNRKKSEEEILRSNERFERAVSATSDTIWDWDVPNKTILWAENYTRMFGRELPENRMQHVSYCSNYVHPEDLERFTQSLENLITDPSQDHWELEFRYRRADGTYAFIRDRGVALRNEEGIAYRVIGAMQDISAEKLYQQELKESSDRLMYVTRATSDVIWDWNIQMNEIFWSDNYTKVLGWEIPENRTLAMDIITRNTHPDDVNRLLESTNKILLDPEAFIWEDEFRYLKSDGTYAMVSDKGFVIRNEKGEAMRMIGAMQDITERTYQQNLLALERTIFEKSNDPKVSFNGVIQSLLEGLETIHPFMITSVLLLKPDNSILSIAAPRLPKEFIQAINGIKIGPGMGSCGTAMYEKRNVIVSDINTDPLWKDFKGLALAFNLQACWSVPIIDRNGLVMGSFAIYSSVPKSPSASELGTIERIRNILRIIMENYFALRKIKIFNDRYDNILKATHDCIWDWNLETGNFYRNEEGIKKVYGVADETAIQNIYSWMQRIHPEDNTRVQRIINDILHATDRDTFDVEYRFKRDDGDYAYIYDRGIILRDHDGKPVRMIGAAQNITDRKKLQLELLQRELDRQKLISQATIDTQEQERSEIGKELHDNVNQILTTTKLYMDLALSNPELKDELIQKSTKNIIYVINEIRQLSRSLMNPSIGDLGLVDSINDLVENINVTRKLCVSLKADEEVEEMVSENQKLMIFRIIQEALNNSIKHAQASSVTIDLSRSKNHVHLVIVDDGIGFNPDKVKKGAGLKNIQNRVYLTNGKLQVVSAPTQGCKLEISFPLNKN